MDTKDCIIKDILDIFKGINSGIGFIGSAVTIYDYWTKKDDTYSSEMKEEMRSQAGKAYRLYCDYREYKKESLGIPDSEKILGYWESCLKRDTLPCVSDMVSEGIAEQEEAEVMLPYLMREWMEIPDFVEWMRSLLAEGQMQELMNRVECLQRKMENISALAEKMEEQGISGTAQILSSKSITDSRCSCCDKDIKYYYMVDNNFYTMLRVISADKDIPCADANKKVMELLREGKPVIISGNGGLGKTSLMMRAAVQWVKDGNLAVWLSLSREYQMTEQGANNFLEALISASKEQRILLCIDNPFEGKLSLSKLRKSWQDNPRIQIIMAERTNRLAVLADSNGNYLHRWFEGASVIYLWGINQEKQAFHLKDHAEFFSADSMTRRKEILEKCTSYLVKEEIITEEKRKRSLQTVLDKYEKPSVSLVELIYRALFELKKSADRPDGIQMDWEEWEDFITSEFSGIRKDLYLYGVIAALKEFGISINLSLFCRYFSNIKERELKQSLKNRFMSHHIEPVIFQEAYNIIMPKHDVVAELFFLFNKGKISISDIILDLLESMEEKEIKDLLSNMIIKKEMQKGNKNGIENVDYWSIMKKIDTYAQTEKISLHKAERAALCLGILWSNWRDKHISPAVVEERLNQLAPKVDKELVLKKLYTEWGIFLGEIGKYQLAEKKIRAVVDIDETDVKSRTELGKLLSRQGGRKREEEAEKLFRKVIDKLERDNVPARTELGILLAKSRIDMEAQKEAEKLFVEAITIDPYNLPPHTELGRLLERQERYEEAKHYLREAMDIDPKHVQSRTVLGRILGKEENLEEAKKVLREAIAINDGDYRPKLELGIVLSKEKGSEKEAKELLLEVQRIDPENRRVNRALESLKKGKSRKKGGRKR